MRNFWNSPGRLYLSSLILLIVSFIACAIINIGFFLVDIIGVAFVIIIAIYLNSWKFYSAKDFSKVLFIAMAIGLVLVIITLIIEGPNVNIGWQEEWHKCYNCNGSGEVTNDYGWKVTCPNCDGVGGLYY